MNDFRGRLIGENILNLDSLFWFDLEKTWQLNYNEWVNSFFYYLQLLRLPICSSLWIRWYPSPRLKKKRVPVESKTKQSVHTITHVYVYFGNNSISCLVGEGRELTGMRMRVHTGNHPVVPTWRDGLFLSSPYVVRGGRARRQMKRSDDVLHTRQNEADTRAQSSPQGKGWAGKVMVRRGFPEPGPSESQLPPPYDPDMP